MATRPVRADGLSRLLLAWTLAYLVLLQAVAGTFAAGTMAGRSDAGAILCLSAQHDSGEADGNTPHDGVVRALHCTLCPASGSVPVLAAAPRLPLPAAPIRIGTATIRGDLADAAPATREHARPRAPPVAA